MLVKRHDIKIDGRMGIRLHAFLTSSFCYKEGSESGAGLLNLEKQTVIHWTGGPRDCLLGSDREQNTSP